METLSTPFFSSLMGLLSLMSCGPQSAAPENVQPLAIAGEDVAAVLDERVAFDGSASNDSDGEITFYQWDFGDGQTAEGVTTQHTYSQSGGFVVTLTVTDDQEATARDELIVTVGESLPEPDVAFTPAAPRQFEEVTFDASASTAAAPITSYQWTFGDGENAQGLQVTHRYTRAGTFPVGLTVTDAENRHANLDGFVDVAPVRLDGTWDLTVSNAFSCNRYDANFADTELLFGTASDDTLQVQSAEGHPYIGSLTQDALVLNGTFTLPTGGTCSEASVATSLRVTLDSADHFQGTVSAYYDLAPPCQCSASFEVEGQRRP